MYKVLFRQVALVAVLVLSCVASHGAEGSSTPRRILFVGNSYTGGMKGTLARLVRESKYKDAELQFISPGGARLAKHVKNEAILKKIREGDWDVVVLQDQSQTPALAGDSQKSFFEAVREFSVVIKDSGAQGMLYMTWGRRDGDKRNAEQFPDYETMQNKLTEAYTRAAKENGMSLAPAGEVIRALRASDDELGKALYAKDGSHNSKKGAFLVSCVFMKALFDDSLDAASGGDALTEAEVKLIKKSVLAAGIKPVRVSNDVEAKRGAALPRVLLIGDSISMGYTGHVKRILQGKAEVVHHKGNAGPTIRGVKHIDEWLGKSDWDIIHFNFGLWDMYGWEYAEEDRRPKEYEKRLDLLVKRLKQTDSSLIWGTTTPVCPEAESTMRKRFNSEVVISQEIEKQYLDAAARVMKKHNVVVNDLHASMAKDLEKYASAADNVHFKRGGYALLGTNVATSIMLEFGRMKVRAQK